MFDQKLNIRPAIRFPYLRVSPEYLQMMSSSKPVIHEPAQNPRLQRNRQPLYDFRGSAVRTGVSVTMNEKQALAVIEDVSRFGILLGTKYDTWKEYVRAREALGNPIDLKPIQVVSGIPVSTGMYPWERELLLPVIQPLVFKWLAANGIDLGGEP